MLTKNKCPCGNLLNICLVSHFLGYRHIDERTDGDPVMAFMEGRQAEDYRGARFFRIPDAYG